MKITSLKTRERYDNRSRNRMLMFIELHGQTYDKLVKSGINWAQFPKVYRKEILPKVLTGKLKGVKASWNRYAGCTCGCSPGFVLDINPALVGYEAMWVNVR
jgi:hypothetical protein